MPVPDSLSTIFFDFDGTLRHSDPSSVESFHRLAAEMGVRASPERLQEAERWIYAYWAFSRELLLDLRRFGGWEDNGPFWTNHAFRHLLKLGAEESVAQELAPVLTARMREGSDPVDRVPPEVPEALRELREMGYRLAVVSNRSKPVDNLVSRLGLEHFLDFTLTAGQAGFWKPDPRLLEHAASSARVEPEEVAYVGDSYFADVAAARAAGMWPVLVDPRGLFPEAECAVIDDVSQLPHLLGFPRRER